MMPPVPAPAAAAPPVSMVAAHARPRPIPAGSRPCADDRARVLRHPYTAMKKPAVLLQCLFDRFGSVFPQCGLMVFPGVVIVSR